MPRDLFRYPSFYRASDLLRWKACRSIFPVPVLGDISQNSNEVSGTTPLAKPTAATATAASSSQLNLTWLDNSASETGYKTERKRRAGCTYSQIDQVGANVQSYSDTSGLDPNTKYCHRIRATNGTLNSDYSNEPSATAWPCQRVRQNSWGRHDVGFVRIDAYKEFLKKRLASVANILHIGANETALCRLHRRTPKTIWTATMRMPASPGTLFCSAGLLAVVRNAFSLGRIINQRN